MRGYIFLSTSIVFELFGSAMLKYSEGFTNMLPTLLLLVAYGISYTFFVFALKTISLSVGYSIWSGVGTAATGLIGVVLFSEVLKPINVLGLIVIIVGVIIMNDNKEDDPLVA